MTTLHPTVLWAQRKDKLFITIDVQDCKDPQIAVTNDDAAKAGKVTFKGLAHSHATGPEEHQYVLELELYGEVDQDDIKMATTARTVTLVIAKKEEGAHWPRLLKASGKTPPYIKADWDKWVDEDEEDEVADDGLGGMDMSMLQQLQGGMGGMGGMGGNAGFDLSAALAGMAGQGGADIGEDGESSDDDLPDLEPAK